MHNYPDGANWPDHYYVSALECGHYLQDECDCWCDGGKDETSHLEDNCDADNCMHLQCQSCFAPTDVVSHVVDNLQRQTSTGRLQWVSEGTPLRWIPQNKLLTARICTECYEEYQYEIDNGLVVKGDEE